jgi:hypothetical protein
VEVARAESMGGATPVAPGLRRGIQVMRGDRWFQWVYSSKSKLHAFRPDHGAATQMRGRSELEKFVISREGEKPKEYRYKSNDFIIGDFAFSRPEVQSNWDATGRGKSETLARGGEGYAARSVTCNGKTCLDHDRPGKSASKARGTH